MYVLATSTYCLLSIFVFSDSQEARLEIVETTLKELLMDQSKSNKTN